MSAFAQQLAARKALRAVLGRLAAAEGGITLSRDEVAVLKAWRDETEAWTLLAKATLLDHKARIAALEARVR